MLQSHYRCGSYHTNTYRPITAGTIWPLCPRCTYRPSRLYIEDASYRYWFTASCCIAYCLGMSLTQRVGYNHHVALQAILKCSCCFCFFLAPNLRGRSVDRHQILTHVRWWPRFIKFRVSPQKNWRPKNIKLWAIDFGVPWDWKGSFDRNYPVLSYYMDFCTQKIPYLYIHRKIHDILYVK